ncbi:glycerol kinase 5 isoform X3 [Oratosquilla oratoria]|uniref:glycerol kinase 5 isoform X3 n=1 Tax=Oratosquilla oratoria TaxID=337810 RepID=UPI003F76AA9C
MNREVGTESSTTKAGSPSYIASLDLGTTIVRCIVYNERAEQCGAAEAKITLLYPQTGYVEMDPDDVWDKTVSVIKEAIQDAHITASSLRCLGIATQRATFLTWNKETGEPFHNFITWKDIRSETLVKRWNEGFALRALHFGASILYFFCRSKQLLAASVLKFMNVQVVARLKWVLENQEIVKAHVAKNNVYYGTIDTWLVYKLTNGKIFATDYSNASGTALFDPFLLKWSNVVLDLLVGIPKSILPQLKDSVGDWGTCSQHIFGAAVPITAVVADQGAAMVGQRGFKKGDIKVTLGTGAFLDLNTGEKPHASVAGIYPVVGWSDQQGVVYFAEGSSNDNGSIIEWGKSIGLYEDEQETSALAEGVEDSEGVFFIPAFEGLQAPVNDASATGGFIGLSASTKREHMIRAMLESLAFRVNLIFTTLRKEVHHNLLDFRVDGGVSRNDFLLRLISTLTGKVLERPQSTDMTALGCAFLAGLGAGIWKNREELAALPEEVTRFVPRENELKKVSMAAATWEKALKRFTSWHMEEGYKKLDCHPNSKYT